jgi:thiol-disulfide isomerase/thioredoxin
MKTRSILLTAAFMTGTLHAEFRTWSNKDGKPATLDLIAKSGEGDVVKGTFRMRNGKTVDLSVADLSDTDALLLKEWKPAAAAVGAASVFDDTLDGNLVKLDGKSLKKYELDNKPTKYYLFYYTASWCGPCHKFTPSLVKFYDANKPSSDEFEIVLITSDRDEKAMEGYAKEMGMNWPQLKLSKAGKFQKEFKHPGTGIPNLVLTDLEGKLIKTSYEGKNYVGPSVVMSHLADLIKK